MSLYSSLQGNSFDVETIKIQINAGQTFYQIYFKKTYNETPVIQLTCEDNISIYIREITNTYFTFDVSFPVDSFVNAAIGKK
jgi:hypothetical protein